MMVLGYRMYNYKCDYCGETNIRLKRIPVHLELLVCSKCKIIRIKKRIVVILKICAILFFIVILLHSTGTVFFV